MKEKFAKFVRILTVPPILITALILILSYHEKEIFANKLEIILSILFLGIVPVLAYPFQGFISGYKNKGREGQRSLAFVMTFAGYLFVLIYGLITRVSSPLLLIYLTYFLSVTILLFFNKVLHLRASGHACSITGALLFSIYFLGITAILPCVVIAILVVWSSLLLKRHTSKDLITGALVCIIAFFLSYCLNQFFIPIIG